MCGVQLCADMHALLATVGGSGAEARRREELRQRVEQEAQGVRVRATAPPSQSPADGGSGTRVHLFGSSVR